MDPFEEGITCGHDAATDTLYEQHPELLQAFQENIEQPYIAEMNLRSFGLQPELSEEEVYVLPVVFHILLPEGYYIEITDEEIQNSLDFLNEQFANIPTSSLPPGQGFNRPDGTNTKIQFALALQDPQGNPTNGINRFNVDFTTIPSSSPNLATNTVAWPGNDYINMWAVADIAGSVAGFAYLPTGPNTQDHLGGIFFKATYLNNTSITPTGLQREYTSYNRVIAHEMGHYLGLRHTFQGNYIKPGCTREAGEPLWKCHAQANLNCLTQGDRICDTPPDSWGSPSTGTTCLGATPQNTSDTDADDTSSNNPFTSDVNDIQANVMDYAGGSCVQQITQNQKERMRTITNFARASLLVSPALEAPEGSNCMYQNPTLSFSPDEVQASSLTESGTVIANIKNNNTGSDCPTKNFTLAQTISDDNVDINIVVNSLSLATQQTGTIEINYTLAMTENTTASLQFQVSQSGQPTKKTTRGILFQTNELNHFVNGVIKQPGASNAISSLGTAPSASNSVLESFSAGGGCASQNAGFGFLLMLTIGLFTRIRFNKLFC